MFIALLLVVAGIDYTQRFSEGDCLIRLSNGRRRESLAPRSLASAIAWSTALSAISEPSVATRICLYITPCSKLKPDRTLDLT